MADINEVLAKFNQIISGIDVDNDESQKLVEGLCNTRDSLVDVVNDSNASAFGDGYYDGFIAAQKLAVNEDLGDYSNDEIMEMSEMAEDSCQVKRRSNFELIPVERQLLIQNETRFHLDKENLLKSSRNELSEMILALISHQSFVSEASVNSIILDAQSVEINQSSTSEGYDVYIDKKLVGKASYNNEELLFKSDFELTTEKLIAIVHKLERICVGISNQGSESK